MAYSLKDRDAYMYWLLTPEGERSRLGLAQSKAEYSRVNGMSTKTLARWEDRDDFQKRIAGERARREVEGDPSDSALRAVVAGGDDPDPVNRQVWKPDESVSDADFVRLKSQLFRRAAEDGELRAIELAMKFFGEDWLEREKASSGVLGDMSDVELAAGVLSRLERPEVVEALSLAGVEL